MMTSYYEARQLARAKNNRLQGFWNMARWAVFHTIWHIPGKKTAWPKTVEKMFPFPWDPTKVIEVPEVTPEEEEAFFKIFENYKKNKK